MGAARSETAGTGDLGALVLDRIRGLGLWPFAVVFAALFFSPYWFVINLVHTLWWDPPALVSADGVNLGRDFVAFFSAASLTLNGEAVSVYDHAAIHAAQQQAIGAPVKFFPWFYPPTMQMFVAPLALMPYLAAFALWILAPLAALLLVVRRYAGGVWASAAILIFPGTAQSVLAGQNGVLSALIIAGGLLNLERRPLLAGAILGLLSYKPHVAAAVYAALFIGRYWSALGAAIAVALALAAASLIVLGPDPWLAFFREAGVARAFTENGGLNWTFMTTAFAAARLAGLDVGVAYALQAVVACGALLALFLVWSRDIPLEQRGAVLVAVIPLITPYSFCYDLAIVGLALLWLAREGFEKGFSRGELVVFAMAWVIAPMGWVLADASNVLVTPLVLVALLCVLLRRILGGADQGALKAP
jgi:hypothetical protein